MASKLLNVPGEQIMIALDPASTEFSFTYRVTNGTVGAGMINSGIQIRSVRVPGGHGS